MAFRSEKDSYFTPGTVYVTFQILKEGYFQGWHPRAYIPFRKGGVHFYFFQKGVDYTKEVVIRGASLKLAAPYWKHQYYARENHDVNEGDRFYLMIPGIKRGDDRMVDVTVTRVDRYFITLRYSPGGYEESMRWYEFRRAKKENRLIRA